MSKLTKKLFAEKMQELAMLYPNWKVEVERKEVMKTWYKQFKDYPDHYFEELIKLYISKKEFPPTVAGIKNMKNEGNFVGFEEA